MTFFLLARRVVAAPLALRALSRPLTLDGAAALLTRAAKPSTQSWLSGTRRSMSSLRTSSETIDEAASGLSATTSKPFAELTVAEKVVETTKDAGSVGVMGFGVVAAGLMIASVVKYLFMKETPRTIYEATVNDLKGREELIEAIGEVSAQSVGAGYNPFNQQQYAVGETEYLRLAFHVTGTTGNGTVQMEMKKSTKMTSILSSYKYRYLLVDVQDAQGQVRRIVLEDNRSEDH